MDVPLHDLLQRSPDPSPTLAGAKNANRTSLGLPSPVFPRHPALSHGIAAAEIAAREPVPQTGKRQWPTSKVMKTIFRNVFTHSRFLFAGVTLAVLLGSNPRQTSAQQQASPERTPAQHAAAPDLLRQPYALTKPCETCPVEADANAKQPKRILWVFPNYRARKTMGRNQAVLQAKELTS
jgi:hypothetical protein